MKRLDRALILRFLPLFPPHHVFAKVPVHQSRRHLIGRRRGSLVLLLLLLLLEENVACETASQGFSASSLLHRGRNCVALVDFRLLKTVLLLSTFLLPAAIYLRTNKSKMLFKQKGRMREEFSPLLFCGSQNPSSSGNREAGESLMSLGILHILRRSACYSRKKGHLRIFLQRMEGGGEKERDEKTSSLEEF